MGVTKSRFTPVAPTAISRVNLSAAQYHFLRTKTNNFATDFFGDYQFAGLPGKGCDLAHHALLAFMDYAAFLHVSSIHIFVDCHNAFYSMVRSLVLEYGDNDQILAYVIQRMGLPQDVASEILEACHRPPAARLAMLPPTSSSRLAATLFRLLAFR